MKSNYMKAMILGAVAVLIFTGSLFSTEMDRRIEASAQKSYVFSTYLKDDTIRVNSQDGVVTLTGTVSEESHIALATDTVADLRGVKSVDNRLEVRDGIPERSSDNWIRIRVKTMLRLHSNLDGENTEVEVRDGRVTLRGEAGNQAEKRLTTEYVEDVEGVKDVNNEMTVAQHYKKHRSFGQFVDDSSIKSQIKLALLFHHGTSPFRCDVSVRRGVVTVTGNAKNAAEKELVTKRIADIHGVKKIHNRMTYNR
jgi:hyperosmotically inducible protein